MRRREKADEPDARAAEELAGHLPVLFLKVLKINKITIICPLSDPILTIKAPLYCRWVPPPRPSCLKREKNKDTTMIPFKEKRFVNQRLC